MPNIDAIKFARTIGLENVAELNKLKKLVARAIDGAEIPAKVEAKLSMTPEQMEAIQQMYIGQFNVAGIQVPNTAGILRGYAPKFSTEGNKIDTVIKIEKFGPRSGKLEVSSKDALGTATSELKVVGNESGIRIKGSGESEIGKSNFDYAYTKDGEKPNVLSVLENTNVTETGDTVRLTIPKTKTGGLRIKADSTLNANAIDAMVIESTGGAFKSLAESIDRTKEILG